MSKSTDLSPDSSSRWQLEVSEILHQNFETLKKKNSRYSLRAFAKKLQISPTALSAILNKRNYWTLSPQRGAELLGKLDIPRPRLNKLLVEMKETPVYSTKTLTKSEHEIFLDWTLFPILFSFDLPLPFRAPQKIAAKLGVGISKVRSAIKYLHESGYLIEEKKGVFKRPYTFIKASDGPPSDVIKKGHAMNLELTLRALQAIPYDKRDFTSLTFVGTQAKVDLLRKEIRQFHERAAAIMNDGENNDQVYKLNIQLFPVDFQ